MCGIAGAIGLPEEIAEPAVARAVASLGHRGPDGRAVETLRGGARAVVLGHTRLAVFDLSDRGRQPMHRGQRAITYNGELYNFATLREELAGQGARFETGTDTEVLLAAHGALGEACVERLRGMFAFCLVELEANTAWLCRDRLGIKPLYLFAPEGGGLLFASELRALLATGLVPRRLSPTALESFFAQGSVMDEASIVEGVRLLAPGTSLSVDLEGRRLRERRFWQLPFAKEAAPISRAEAAERVRAQLEEAVRRHLASDAPAGLFLSGGLDSAAIAALARRVSPGQLRAVSVGFDDPALDETDAARETARHLELDHRVVRLDGARVLEQLPEALAAVDQPTVDGFNTFFVSRAAREAGLTVALSGLGGDELFGGYASFRDVPRALRLGRAVERLGPPGALLASAARALPFDRLGRGPAKLQALLDRAPTPLALYLLRRELFPPEDRRALHALPPAADPEGGLPRAELEDLAGLANALAIENQLSLFELSLYLRHMLLRDSDVFSMASGLELRVPLLDHVLVDTVAPLEASWKRSDGRPKPLLQDALGRLLPPQLARRPKRGFTFPWARWLRGPLRGRAEAAVGAVDVWRQAGIAADAPAALWRRFLRGDRRVAATEVLALWVLADFVSRHSLRSA